MQNALILALAALTAAAPLDAPKTSTAPAQTKYEATFDDLSSLTQNVALQEVGPYDGLDYKGIDLISLGLDGTIVAGVTPRTYPNAGVYLPVSGVLDGAPSITTQYEGSVTDTFDFEGFWFGCIGMSVEAVASAPLSCDVTVAGFKASLEVARQTFSFKYNVLTDLLTAPMVKAKLSNAFKGIDSATFSTEYDVTNAVGATLLDSLRYTTYNAKDKVEKN
ncbi:hypothetical protein EG328_004650 [Venturia inaequalis]|uniref:Uncharacterized protein n=1 Tax=Venturia inaequalis TaxID=5025 RepID=A0A8H3UG76_VENIN|nr:hypothetical protein EG327_011181 [Venturia inaequalis]KAE9973038.1 hypothetical protein EG328_004650 [Venturia inaequalis]